MRKKFLCLSWLVVACLMIPVVMRAASDEDEGGNRYTTSQGFVLHEWGVLKIRQDGYLQGVVEDLPEFVKWEQSQEFDRCAKKPVIHLYAPEETRLSVRVSAEQCYSWCQWPPKAAEADAKKGKMPVAMVTADIRWDDLIVLAPGAKSDMRAVAKTHWWSKTRAIPSNHLKAGGEGERFLFYEAGGISFLSPVILGDVEGAMRLLVNGLAERLKEEKEIESAVRPFVTFSTDALRNVLMVRVANGKGQVVFSEAPGVDGNCIDIGDIERAESHVLDSAEWKNQTVSKLEAVLAGAGLYTEESETVAEIWNDEFFRADGTRVVYLLPEETYNQLFPLAIEKHNNDGSVDAGWKPKSIKRVMLVCLER